MPAPRVFVSHSGIDSEFAEMLVRDLRKAGADAWLDRTDMPAGDYVTSINASLARCEWFVLVLTENALASPWVQGEVNAAIARSKSGLIRELIFIRTSAVAQDRLPPLWATYQIFDAMESGQYQMALNKTLKELRLSPNGISPEEDVPASHNLVIRNVVAAAVLCLSVVAGIVLGIGNSSRISSAQTDPASELAAALAGLVLAVIVAYFKLRTSGRALNSKVTAELLFDALKQTRNNRSFNLDMLSDPIPLTVQDYEKAPDAPGASIVDAYQASNNLLILGEPGSGKTTLLQQLAVQLMDEEIKRRAITEQAERLPVFLSLHEWSRSKRKSANSFKAWVRRQFMNNFSVQGLYSVYGLRRSLVNHWLRKGDLILLLDGLDEMNEEDSKNCIVAINKLRSQTRSPFVITCQQDRYERLAGSQHILNVGQKTVTVQSVTPSQALDYFTARGATRLATIARQDIDQSQGLPHTPLHLHVLAQTYADDSRNWEQPFDLSANAVMRTYVKQAIGPGKTTYGGRDLRYWLAQLASRMGDNHYFRFRAQDLPDTLSKIFNFATVLLMIVLLAGLASLPAAIGTFPLWQMFAVFALIAGVYGYLQFLPIIALIPGIFGFLLKSVATGICMTGLYVVTLALPFFAFASSGKKTPLQKLMEVLATYVIILLPVILLTAAIIIGTQAIGMPIWLGLLAECMLGGLFWYVSYALGGLQLLLRSSDKSSVLYTWLTVVYMMLVRLIDPIAPNTLSPRGATPLGITMGLGAGAITGLAVWLAGTYIWHTNLLLAAILLGTSIWLDQGVGASLRGYILRFWFWRAKMLPWSARFLDDAVTAGLLEEHGGSYRFVYGKALQDYLSGKSRE